MLTQLYNASSSKVGKRFFEIMSIELDGVHAGKWNVERMIIFQYVILKISKGVNSSVQIYNGVLF